MPRTGLLPLGLCAVCTGALVWSAVELRSLRDAVAGLDARTTAAERQLETVAGEVTRFRIEQRAEGSGPQALLERLRTYAGQLVSARTTQPDYDFARAEMDAVLRAFGSLGDDAFTAIRQRFEALEPKQAFDEMHWLLEAAARSSPEHGKALVAEVLAGTKKPSARLRWIAADIMLRIDRKAAQQALRQILLTETSRGVDPDRAVAYRVPLLDPAAVAVSGFHNFVVHYLRSEDPEAEETLIQVLNRTNQDVPSLQVAIEALGERRCARADKRIEDLFRSPPGAQQNPIFLNKCLDALVAIRGRAAARPFLEEQLPQSQHELVTQHIQFLLQPESADAAIGPPAAGEQKK